MWPKFKTLVPTNLRPDLVWWEDDARVSYVVELTVCYETNFGEAAERKMAKLKFSQPSSRERLQSNSGPSSGGLTRCP